MDLAFYNPLDVEITVSNLTVVVKEATSQEVESRQDFIETEVVDEITLGSHETRTVCLPGPRCNM